MLDPRGSALAQGHIAPLDPGIAILRPADELALAELFAANDVQEVTRFCDNRACIRGISQCAADAR